MTNEEILANAPKGSTNYDSMGAYIKDDRASSIRSLSDIRRIVELESELKAAATACKMLHSDKEAAERERDELKASIEKFTTGIDELTADYLYSGDDTAKLNCELKVRGNSNSVESLESFLVDHLRQQLNGGEHADCELECGAYGTYCKCKSEKLAKQDKGGE